MEETIHTCICMTNVENIAYLIASFYYFTNINYNFHIQEEKFNSFLSIFRNPNPNEAILLSLSVMEVNLES